MNFELFSLYLEKGLNILGSKYLLLLIEFSAIILKGTLLILLFVRAKRSGVLKKFFLFLVALVLISSLIENISWLISLSKELFASFISIEFRRAIVAFAWFFTPLHYQALGLLVEGHAKEDFKFTIRHVMTTSLGLALSTYYLFSSIFLILSVGGVNSGIISLLLSYRTAITGLTLFYCILVMSISFGATLIERYKNKHHFPVILRQQLKVFLYYLLIPYVALDMIPALFDLFRESGYSVGHVPAIIKPISEILLTYALFFATRKMIRLRFLNFQDHVQSITKFSFIDHFKNVLETLSRITNIYELNHITQLFFRDIFAIPLNRTHLFIRNTNLEKIEKKLSDEISATESMVENFITILEQNNNLYQCFKKNKILIHDELSYNNYYESTTYTKTLLNFMEQIDADVFIPIFHNHSLSAYIIVERQSRSKELFTDVERDEMLLFAQYIGNIIYLLHNRNLSSLIEQQKEIKEELYLKHQEINQYKESMRTFLRISNNKKIGILFYKNRLFTFANQTAHELITININTQEGHPLSKAIKSVARDVLKFHSPQYVLSKNAENEKIVIFGLLNLEKNNVIILVYYPEISDIIRKQIDMLQDPSNWDYLLYLETTKPGQLINELIPSNSETIINFKINLLKIALNKKAILLDIPEEDLQQTVEIIHHISLRDTLHIIHLQAPVTKSDVCISIFGMNPIFAKEYTEPLLAKLHNTGTLFIKNIHFLDSDTQTHLAEYLRYGYYHFYKSDHSTSSNVRIITSTNQNLSTLVKQGIFSQELYNELSKTTLIMPSLLTFPEQELKQLIEDFSRSSLETESFSSLLEFTEREKERLLTSGIVSLHEFKERIQKLLIQKSKSKNIQEDIQFNPAYHVTDPDLLEAAKMGKHALKDPKIMTQLWNKFKSQNKIALFLGVNRSSVNRRCKEYKLIDEEEKS